MSGDPKRMLATFDDQEDLLAFMSASRKQYEKQRPKGHNDPCRRCGGSGELYRLYDRQKEKLVTFRSGEKLVDAMDSDRYRMPEDGDGQLTHPYPQCPVCKGHGKGEPIG